MRRKTSSGSRVGALVASVTAALTFVAADAAQQTIGPAINSYVDGAASYLKTAAGELGNVRIVDALAAALTAAKAYLGGASQARQGGRTKQSHSTEAASGAAAAAHGASHGGNTQIEDFATAKRLLMTRVYSSPRHRQTLYCGFDFSSSKTISLPASFSTPSFGARAGRIEFEHVVPAENFGRAFPEWTKGSPACGRTKGRKCADLANREYRLMQADMYNLFPASGAVNALRSNYRYTQFSSSTPPTFGSCEMKIDRETRQAEPPDRAKGEVARVQMYFAKAYPSRYRLSDAQRRLFEAWDRQFPVTAWECERAAKIERLQGNRNSVLAARCPAH